VQLADGGARAQFAVQTIERRFDERVEHAQAGLLAGNGRSGDGEESQYLVERSADAESIARLALDLLRHTVEIAARAGAAAAQRFERGMEDCCRVGLVRPQRLGVGIGKHDPADAWTKSLEQLCVRLPSADRCSHACKHPAYAAAILGRARHFAALPDAMPHENAT